MAAIPPADIIALPSENIFSSTGRHQTIYFHIKNTGPRRIFFSITTTSTKAIFKPNNGLINGHGEVILEVNCTGYFVGEEKEAFMVHWSNEAEDSTLAAHKATGFHRRKQMFLIYNPPKDFYFNAPFHNQQTYYTRIRNSGIRKVAMKVYTNTPNVKIYPEMAVVQPYGYFEVRVICEPNAHLDRNSSRDKIIIKCVVPPRDGGNTVKKEWFQIAKFYNLKNIHIRYNRFKIIF